MELGLARDTPASFVPADTVVLGYHAVSPSWTVDISVTQEALEAQLGFFIRRGWQAATFRDVALGKTGPRTIVVTFDDAFLSVFELALPVLSSLGLPATVFAPTSFMSERQRLTWSGIDHWQPESELIGMCWEDLGNLVEAGWEIGSHTRTHPHLPRLGSEDLSAELLESRVEIADKLGVSCDTIAYPYDDVDDRVALAAAEAGYLAGTASKRQLKHNGMHRFPRVGVYKRDPTWRFRLKASRAVRYLRTTDLWPQR